VLEIETQALTNLLPKIDEKFAVACELIMNCKGRVIITGMGKSGHIGKKIAATLASTGTPAFFVHPAEALHGDCGMIIANDVILAISYSGETEEILKMVPLIKRLGLSFITLTGVPNSQLAKLASINIDVSVEKEACVLGLAPTASTTTALAMGDAIAISILKVRGFTAEDFARSHPGGKLGRKLLIKISDLMRTKDNIPRISENSSLTDTIIEMSKKRLGMVLLFKNNNQRVLSGVFTDGDLRRVLEKGLDVRTIIIKDVMTTNFKTISSDMLAVEALRLMEHFKINGFPVVDEHNNLIGAFNMHDLLQAGVA
jgi:arabinose-5-phosphate isomerase